ncbi:hypothetical protein BCR42DRAFT_444402 [Absidia repens]|uniref:C2H2-type domain-containing protein n=1 Tax=Absidia repens TaxID=90262 RepID=A0A1X2HRC6_9FUNG|nr:hypothetical protein BCR42DRAFT_444402 [Absidia repens]
MSSSDIVNRSNEQNSMILSKKSCPYCDKLYHSNQKAVNHIVALHQKKVERLPSGNRNFGVYSQANTQKYERLGYSIQIDSPEQYQLSGPSKRLLKDLSKNHYSHHCLHWNHQHCDLNHVIASQPENGIITAPEDIIKLGWIFFLLPDNDHLVFQNIDITKGFHEFRHYVKTIIDEPRLLTYESHVQHVLGIVINPLAKTMQHQR